jgi:hypothetical protein
MIKLLGVQTVCLCTCTYRVFKLKTIILVEFQTLYQVMILSGKRIKEIILVSKLSSISYLKEISLFLH